MYTAINFAWCLILIPLGASAILLLLGRLADAWGHILGVLGALVPAVLAIAIWLQLLGLGENERAVMVRGFTWLDTGELQLNAMLQIDPLSIAFALLITVVGSLIFIYSVAYMAHDPGRRRFFAFMNLFIAAMLLLVLAGNYVILFIGWEGVGLASYLLIGFWQHKPEAAVAAKKAFIMNRIGDLGLIGAMALLLSQTGSLWFSGSSSLSPQMATIAGCLLLLAACGKSAQVPLQGWLADAMEGPTPVSALIHAATMVTAGVYLVVRSQPIFALSPAATWAVAGVGAVTLLVGAWIGTAKRDIKKVLAGSTMSQIGYMILAAGLGPAGAAFAIFHLLTHGAFKANLFLGAGAVMHSQGGDTDMRNYGALRAAMPWTFLAFACGSLAIIGFPMTSGFYSKEHIITAAFAFSPIVGGMALLGAMVTAFYITRLVMLTFFGEPRWPEGTRAHEAPALMVAPMALLGLASLVMGVLLNGRIVEWLAPVVGSPAHVNNSLLPFSWVLVASLVAVATGVLGGVVVYNRGPRQEKNLLMRAGEAELGTPVVGNAVAIAGVGVAEATSFVDRYLVDGGQRAGLRLATGLSGLVRNIQNGKVRSYGLIMTLGLVAVLVGVVIVGQVI